MSILPYSSNVIPSYEGSAKADTRNFVSTQRNKAVTNLNHLPDIILSKIFEYVGNAREILLVDQNFLNLGWEHFDPSINQNAMFLGALKTNQVQTLSKIVNHTKFDCKNFKPGELEEAVHLTFKNKYFEIIKELLKLPWFDLKNFLYFPFNHNLKFPIYLACKKSRVAIFNEMISHFDQLVFNNSLSSEEMQKFLRDALFAATSCQHSSMTNLRMLLNHPLTGFKELMGKDNNQSKEILNPMDAASQHDNREACALFLDFLGDAVFEVNIQKNIFRSFALAMYLSNKDVFHTILNWPLKIIQGDISQFIWDRDLINKFRFKELMQIEGIRLDFKFFQQIIGNWNLKVFKCALKEKIDVAVLERLGEPIVNEIRACHREVLHLIREILKCHQKIDLCVVLKDPIILDFLNKYLAEACKYNILSYVKEVLKHPLIDVSTRKFLTIARKYRNEEIVKELISHPTARGF